MDEKENKEYTYSSQTKEVKEETKKILQQYIPPEENLIEQLRKLDEKAKKPGLITSICLGIFGLLILGVGMSIIIEWRILVPGTIIGVIGIFIMGIAYPLYLKLLKKGKKKYSSEIIRMSNGILNK